MKTNTWSALDARDTYAKANSTQWAAGYLYTDDGLGNYRFDATAWPIGGGPARILTPTGSIGSDAFAVSGSMVAGWTENAGKRHAYVWDMATGKQYDLHPEEAVAGSDIAGLDGTRAVGTLGLGAAAGTHAVLWNDVTKKTYVDLDPDTWPGRSKANALSGDSQVGYVHMDAALWHGTAESWVNLHPYHIPTANYSIAFGVYQNVQVGITHYAMPDGTGPTYASVWFGSAESFFDLHSLLEPGYYRNSRANDVGVAEDGTIYIVGYGAPANGGPAEALLWTYVVPEPGSLAALALGLAGLPFFRRLRGITCRWKPTTSSGRCPQHP